MSASDQLSRHRSDRSGQVAPPPTMSVLRGVLLLAGLLLAALVLAVPAWGLSDEVVSWGAGGAGELGYGGLTNKSVPIHVCAVGGCNNGRLDNVLAVSAGGEHSLALLSNHEVVAWGRAREGALGNGELTPNVTWPERVCAIAAAPVTTASPCPHGPYLEHVIAISAGDDDSNVALLESGEVVTWASNKSGNLGAGYTPSTKWSLVPVYVCGPTTPFTSCTAPERLKGVTAVSAAPDHDAAIIQPGGELLTWGVNKIGQLGQGDYNAYNDVPKHVCEVEYEHIAWAVSPDTSPACPAGSWLTGVEAITFGLEHNIATFSGPYKVRIWSEESEHQLENEENRYTRTTKSKERKEKPKGHTGMPEIVELEASHSVVSFGNNEEAQLGTGVSIEPKYATGQGGPQKCEFGRPCAQVPMHVCKPEVSTVGTKRCGVSEYLEPVSSISAGGAHSLARQEHGEVISWGENTSGTVGDETLPSDICSFTTLTCSPVPWHVCTVTCSNPTERIKGISEIAGGEYHDLGLSEAHEVVSWGENAEGQLGNGGGPTARKPGYVCEPELITCPGHLKEVTQISAGLTHSLAIVQCKLFIAFQGAKDVLPSAQSGLPYNYRFQTGCNQILPWEWKVVTGGLPNGLLLNKESGEITGKPLGKGTFEFTIEVTNAEKESATAAAAISVIGTSATPCSGSDIIGAGAALQKLAQQSVWGPGFNSSANALACSGTQGTKATPTVGYEAIGSGAGLEDWGVNGHGFEAGRVAFIGTDEPPNERQKTEIEGNQSTPGSVPASLQTIPVAQESIAVVMHLPANCAASSTAAPGRLVLDNSTLEKIWAGEIDQWSQISDDGDALSGAGCEPNTPITRIARLDSAGSTHILKKYLSLINSGSLETEAGRSTWSELAEGASNTVWPSAAAVTRPASGGDDAEIASVAETPGSIGYAGLADARASTSFVPPAGGPGTANFWAPLENSMKGTGAKITRTYADPSSDDESAATANANCTSTTYTDGKGAKFPPASTEDAWNEVTTATTEKHYTLCGLTYELALGEYAAYPATSEPEATTVDNYLLFQLETKAGGGQSLILNHDYEPLPKDLDSEAKAGAARAGF